MANWVTVENEKITGYYDMVPDAWKNISGLNKSQTDLEFMRNVGWLPVQRQNPAPYDESIYELGSFEYEIQETVVLEIPVVTLRPQQEPTPTFEERKAEFMALLRQQRNRLLSDSDYTQVADVQSTLDETTRIRWITYRQTLRDLPAKYVDNDILSLENVSWPEV